MDMQLFGQSLKNLADAYLHAGYCSAPPAPLEFAKGYPTLLDQTDTGYAVALDEAFRLADVGDAAATAATGPDVAVLIGAVGIAAALLGILWLRLPAWRGVEWRRRLAPATAAGLAVICACFSFPACDPTEEGSNIPWDGVEIREYADPWAALNVTAQALVADAATEYYHSGDWQNLDFELLDFQDHVRLPTSHPTEGQEYAQTTYGLDGWGHEMRYDMNEHETSLSSAGPDGAWDTADDLTVHIEVLDRYTNTHWAYYLVRLDGTLWLMTRREPDRNTHDGIEACTGDYPDGTYYDGVALTQERLEVLFEIYDSYDDYDWSEDIAGIQAFYDSFVTPENPEPVVFQYWGPTFEPEQDAGSG
jgi:hypothetical protein